MMADKEGLGGHDPLIGGQQTFQSLDNTIASVVQDQKRHSNKPWMATTFIAFIFVNILMVSVGWLVYQGIGIWGNNVPAGWAFDIINFVWWIGIGHAGTLISAILLLLRQQWRNSINRFSEAMTIFAVMCAAMFPLFHTGRPWVAFYWLLPYPNIMGVWPQFRSPLIWDVFAVSTYFTVSLVFWLVGLVPDFGTLRDRAEKVAMKRFWAILAMGWRGSQKHWHRYEQAYLILAGISTPLVLSVHSIVSLDFAVSIVPGWNTAVFPPYFVAGAVFAGFAMVLLLAIPIRAIYGLKDLITMRHIDWCAKIMLTTGLIVFFGYMLEVYYGWYSGEIPETRVMLWRFFGPYKYLYWLLILCNGVIPQLMWSPKARRHIPTVWFVCLVVSLGMWLERFVIIPMSLTINYLPASDRMYYPTLWDFGMFTGTIGFFVFMMFLFVRFLPTINMFEMKDLLHTLSHGKARKVAVGAKGGR
ncbi:MAG: polysulfide reductase NrfD [Fimbriimonas ginsengisoli]|uniref:Polysulfide reductase NrfD n=1 Tax=Fimbriimonas ginsengisoli TaxID=1005039 RepID=A0A931LT13_FIMGI|nr:polysulfide reductase NrfD [Fimbriimonas ginsengisoli]